MIYKNNEPYKLTKEEIRMYSGKVTFMLTPELVKWDAEDQRVRKPNSIHLEPRYFLFDKENGSTYEVRYVTSTMPKKDGNVSYTEFNPSEIVIPPAGKIIVDNDPEFCYFLSNHPANQDSPNFDTNKTAIFMIENRAEQARKRIKANEALYEAQSLLFHPTEGLSEKDLRALARSYPDLAGYVDGYTIEQVKDMLMNKARINPTQFIKAARDQRTAILNIVTMAKEMNLLQYVAGKRSWVLKEGGVEKDTILVVKKDKDAIEALLDYLIFEDKKNTLAYFTRMTEKTDTTVEA